MADRRDPVQAADDGSIDLYDVATWEPRSRLDRFAGRVYRFLLSGTRAIVVLLAFVILVGQFALIGAATVENPVLGIFIFLSIVPAAVIAAYVWRADVARRAPLSLLVGTYLLGILLAGLAAAFDTAVAPVVMAIPLIGPLVLFYLLVGPVEETVKWLAVRLYAYRHDAFGAVVDGAVYGAVAGLGFATIENALYISGPLLRASQGAAGGAGPAIIQATLTTAAIRSFAGPGHVIYAGFSGYYLGLAKFNRENAGPIVVKGLLIAVFIHGTYNTIVTSLPALVSVTGLGVGAGTAFLGFVVVYDGLFLGLLFRKIRRYRSVYRRTVVPRRTAEAAAAVAADAEDPAVAVREDAADPAVAAEGPAAGGSADGPATGRTADGPAAGRTADGPAAGRTTDGPAAGRTTDEDSTLDDEPGP